MYFWCSWYFESARALEGETFHSCLIKYCKKWTLESLSTENWKTSCLSHLSHLMHLFLFTWKETQRKRELSSPFFIDSIMFFSSEFRKKLDSFRIYQLWVRSLWGKYFLTISGIIISTDWRLIQKSREARRWLEFLTWGGQTLVLSLQDILTSCTKGSSPQIPHYLQKFVTIRPCEVRHVLQLQNDRVYEDHQTNWKKNHKIFCCSIFF